MADRVVFLRPDAERIARAVRQVEGLRQGSPLTFRRAPELARRADVFRVCTFDGAWATGTPKTVTFKYQASTPNTVSALNLFFPITENAVAADCAVAKEGTAWYLIDVPFATATVAVLGATATGFYAQATALITFASAGSAQTVVSDISISATLDTSDCSITVSKTVSTASITGVGETATAVSISSVATAIFATQTATATVLRFKVA